MKTSTLTLVIDRNGNRVLRISGARPGIQTNGAMPRTHRDGIGPWTMDEVRAFVEAYGTPSQRRAIG